VIAILSSRLLEQAPGSELHDKHRLQPTVFYWQNEFFENATTASRAGADVWHKPLMGACIRAGGRHRRWMMRGVRCRATSSMPREKAETPASGRFRLTDEVAYFRMAYNPFPFASLGFEAAARSSPRAVEEARNGSSSCRLCCPGTALTSTRSLAVCQGTLRAPWRADRRRAFPCSRPRLRGWATRRQASTRRAGDRRRDDLRSR
jgi:hypothetical protein